MVSRKSQVIGQVFIYIMAIIIFSLILIYGYRIIRGFGKETEKVSLIQLNTEIKTSINKIKTDYGTVVKKELLIPSKYLHVCLVDLEGYGQSQYADICKIATVDYHPQVCNSWKDNSQYNMFLITSQEEIEPHYIEGIKIKDEDYVCTEVKQGKIVLRLEGKGDHVEVSEWE